MNEVRCTIARCGLGRKGDGKTPMKGSDTDLCQFDSVEMIGRHRSREKYTTKEHACCYCNTR